ncbi:head GIN domain-containing protein [Spirochaetota bacterium]
MISLFDYIFWGSVLVLIGVWIIAKNYIQLSIPLWKIIIGIIFVYIGLRIMFKAGPGCCPVRESGNMITETRTLSSFDSVEFRGYGNLFITRGEEHSVAIAADEAVIQRIRTDVGNGKLVINTDFYIKRTAVDIHLTVPTLKSIRSMGAGTIKSDQTIASPSLEAVLGGVGKITLAVDVDSLSTRISGAGKIELSGTARDHSISLSGAGKLDAFDLLSEGVRVQSTGAGKCEVHASKTLDVTISGVGKVEYKGDPAVTQSITGFGSLKRKNN